MAVAEDAVARLADALGTSPPRGVVRALDAADIEHLAEVIEDARRSQRQELREAIEAGYKHIPFPLRIAVKKVLG